MEAVQQRLAAKEFIQDWQGRGDEKQDAQNFWRQLLHKVYGVEDPEKVIAFEKKVPNFQTGTTIFIDAYIAAKKVLIEQKGKDINLRKGYKQSDGSVLTPYQQARRYAGLLPYDMVPRWIVVCNFQEFHLHDMLRPNDDPLVVKLADLEKEYSRLEFMVPGGGEGDPGGNEIKVSFAAGKIVGKIYNAFHAQYKEPDSDRQTPDVP